MAGAAPPTPPHVACRILSCQIRPTRRQISVNHEPRQVVSLIRYGPSAGRRRGLSRRVGGGSEALNPIRGGGVGKPLELGPNIRWGGRLGW